MSTIHINAKKNDFAKIIIMTGDPLKAKYIAKKFLSNIKLINNIRGMLAYTGIYKKKKISVMGHGIGIPSCSIYIRELINNFGIKKIIKAGSCGAIKNNIKLNDIIVGMGASTDSKINRKNFKNYDFAAIADFNLVKNIVDAAKLSKINIHIGNIFTTDLFYSNNTKLLNLLEKYNILGIEMEAAGIYNIAAEFGISAMTICNVSDHIKKKESLSAIERQYTFNEMIKIILKSINL
ncbi:MAG: purine-nucleoside phosphorylase [gamma proteobacterium endosymbiont of Trioza apicalis]